MRVALVMEWSTSAKNEIVYNTLKKVAASYGHTVDNYGQFNMEAPRMTYNQNAILIATILASGAADFVVTGCGTGEGACIAANAMPGVNCGLVIDPSDAYLFTQINNGNVVSLPYAKGYGWGGEVNLEYVFEKLFAQPGGGGYPESAAQSEKTNYGILQEVKKVAHHDIRYILENADHDLVKMAFWGPDTMKFLRANAKDQDLIDFVEKVIAD